ncbi:hypothetical protein M2298_000543 [Brevibacillus sp. 1238]|jgi:hypothetical protein|nr:hypothetical protein [Brevibacillus sp. 1238]
MSTTLRSGICEGNGKGGFAEVWRKTRLSPCWVCIEQVQDCHLALDRRQMESYLTVCRCER